MKNSKKGISLIVLVITIIVIIILAAAVLLSMNNNNPIENSKSAVVNNDAAELKSALSLYIANFMANDANHNSPFGDNEEIKVVKSTTETAPSYAGNVGDTTTTAKEITFAELGVTSNSIDSFTFNTKTNKFVFTPVSGYPTPN